MTNTPNDAAWIATRLHRLTGLNQTQIDSLSLSLDPIQVDQINDADLASLVNGTLPSLPLNPSGGLPLGLTGATQAARFVGGTTSGAPTSGTFLVRDWVVTGSGAFYACTAAGSPGTWVQVGGGGGAVASVAGKTGTVTLVKADVGLSSVDNTADTAKPVSTAQAAAVTAVTLSDVAAAVTANGALTLGKHNPVDASGGAKAMTLANAAGAGQLVSVEKTDSSTNAVTITLNLRGSSGSTLSLAWQNEALLLAGKTDGSWWPVSGHKTKASLDAAFAPLATVPFYGLPSSPQVRAMAAEAAMTVAPTFTEVNSLTSTLTNPKSYTSIAAGAPFKYDMSDSLVFSTNYIVPYGPTTSVARAADVAQPLLVSFDFDGQAFEIDTNNQAALNFRVWANEQESASFGPPSQAGRKLIKVDFGSRAYRRVVIEFDGGTYFAGVVVAGTDTVLAPSVRHPLKFAGVGDSYMYGYGYRSTNSTARSYFTTTARMLGFANTRKYAVSGTGFIATPGGGAQTYPNRISDVLSYQPDIVLVQGSINDSAQTANAIQTAATSYLTTLKAGLPSTSRIVLTSPLRVLTPTSGDITITTGLAAAAAALGIPFIDATNTGWFSGSGTTSAPTGTGNADFYQSGPVVTHPSIAGHLYLGNQIAREMARLLGLGL